MVAKFAKYVSFTRPRSTRVTFDRPPMMRDGGFEIVRDLHRLREAVARPER